MDFLNVLILGAVEGLTEFLPISSTAHILLASKVLNIAETEFFKSFTIAIQLGAIFAVVTLYAKKLLTDWETNKRIFTAFLPTAVIGFGLYKIIKNFFFENNFIILGALFLGGIFLIVFERFHKEKETADTDIAHLPYSKAFFVGCAQALAVVPGVSRAAATIIGGMMLGIERKAIVEFSFLLAVPTMLAATGYDLLKNASGFSLQEFNFLLLGFVFSFIFAMLGVKFLLNYIKTNSFAKFGIYRIIIAVLFASYLL